MQMEEDCFTSGKYLTGTETVSGGTSFGATHMEIGKIGSSFANCEVQALTSVNTVLVLKKGDSDSVGAWPRMVLSWSCKKGTVPRSAL